MPAKKNKSVATKSNGHAPEGVTLTAGPGTTDRDKAQWALANAANLLSGEYKRTRATDERAEELALAAAISWQLVRSLAADATDVDRAGLRRMAHGLPGGRPKIDKSEAERQLLEVLPKTARTARRTYPNLNTGRPRDDDGSVRLAHYALIFFAEQLHADAAKILRRWGIDHAGDFRNSAQYAEDEETLASEVRALMSDSDKPGQTFAEALVPLMYRVLKLKRPLEALKHKTRV